MNSEYFSPSSCPRRGHRGDPTPRRRRPADDDGDLCGGVDQRLHRAVLWAAFRSTVPITVPRESLASAQSIIQGVSAVAELARSVPWLRHRTARNRVCDRRRRFACCRGACTACARARGSPPIDCRRARRHGSGEVVEGVRPGPSLLGTRLTLFGGGLITAAAAMLLAGPAVRRVHTAADVSVASEATGIMS